MSLIPVRIPPGIKRAGTEYQARGRWFDANLVRWFEDTMRPVGGWRPLDVVVNGVPRAAISWRTTDGKSYLAIGTNKGIFAYTGGTTYDLTASGTTGGGTDTSGRGRPYGTGLYGIGPYSGSGGAEGGGVTVPGVPMTLVESATWSLDNFGNYLVGVLGPSDGKVRLWDLDPAHTMDVISTAPTGVRAVVVSPERFLFALGTGGAPNTVAWASQETTDVWTSASDNTAGDFPLTTDGRLMAGLRMPRETLLFTDTDLHSAVYIGGTLVYQFDRRGTKCGAVSPHSMVAVGDLAYWMSDQGFFRYDGTVAPIPCEVFDYVFSRFNRVQSLKTYAVSMSQFREVWWFYCSNTSDEIDSYVIYNYQEDKWYFGELSRSCGVDRGVFPYPILCSPLPVAGLTSSSLILGLNFNSALTDSQALSAIGWEYHESVSLGVSRYHRWAGPWSFYPLGLLGNTAAVGSVARRPSTGLRATEMTALLERGGVDGAAALAELCLYVPGGASDQDKLHIRGGIARSSPTTVNPLIEWVDAAGTVTSIGVTPPGAESEVDPVVPLDNIPMAARGDDVRPFDQLIIRFRVVAYTDPDLGPGFQAQLFVGHADSTVMRLVRIARVPDAVLDNKESGIYSTWASGGGGAFAHAGFAFVSIDGARQTAGSQVFEHERGMVHTGAGPIFAESGPLELGDGTLTYMIRHVYPDEKTLGDVQMKFMAAFHPTGPETTKGPYAGGRPTAVRVTGRQLRLRLEQIGDDVDWRVGEYRLDGALAGER